jgi:hypothetical protein
VRIAFYIKIENLKARAAFSFYFHRRFRTVCLDFLFMSSALHSAHLGPVLFIGVALA